MNISSQNAFLVRLCHLFMNTYLSFDMSVHLISANMLRFGQRVIIRKQLEISALMPHSENYIERKYSDVGKAAQDKTDPSALKAEKKKKSLFITLIGLDGKMSTSTLEAATKLAKRRDLKLIKVADEDLKKENPLYKLISTYDIISEEIDLKKKSKDKGSPFKSEKIITISSRISDNDLDSKIKMIDKWLEKKHVVRATIELSPGDNLAEPIYQKLESRLQAVGKFLQKRVSGDLMKFYINPILDKKEGKDSDKRFHPVTILLKDFMNMRQL